MKVHTFEDIERIIKSQKYNHCGLYKQESGKWKGIVPFNREKNAKASPDNALKKLKEIKTRLEVMEDGFYFIRCCTMFTPTLEPDAFLIKKGNVPDENQPVNVTVNMPALKENAKPIKEHLLSVDQAINHVKENAKLLSENEVLKAENERLKKQVSELEAELDAVEDENEDEDGGMGEGMKSFFSSDSPFAVMADKYFALEERRQLMKEREQFMKFQRMGFNGNGFSNQRPKRMQQNGNGQQRQPPQPGTQQYEAYITKLENMSDEEFNVEMDALAKMFPDFYETVKAEFEESAEGNEGDE